VNRALADRYFPGRSPVGQRLADFGPMGTDAEIVGVVGDARYRSLRDEPAPMIYVAHSQFFMPHMSMVVRTTVPPASMRHALVAAAAAVDPELPLFQIKTMPERLRGSLAVERLLAWLLSAFAALAVFLAAAGLYAVVSYTTTLRTREFGIRVALGATARHLRLLVVTHALWLVGAGVLAGLVGAWASARALGTLLFAVGPTDLSTYLAVGGLLTAVGVAAVQWPARRAARVDPISALRAD
jgi:predicted lysophospholipase L1 biosynthesis ABC-type transport system permease subunit